MSQSSSRLTVVPSNDLAPWALIRTRNKPR